MKVLYALIFFALGGVLYFLLQTPEKEAVETEVPIARPKEMPTREIIAKTFYPPVVETKKTPPAEKENDFKKELQLNLKEASNNELFGGLISGTQAIGSLTIFDNQIQSLSLNLTPFGRPPINFQLEGVPLESAGSFVHEYNDELISGIFSPSGDKDYMLRFATGPLVGSTFLFEKVGIEDQTSQASTDPLETQEMNQESDTYYSEMNNEPPNEEMPVNEMEVNREQEVLDNYSDVTPSEMEESTDGPFNI
jgi:hypothetical protein